MKWKSMFIRHPVTVALILLGIVVLGLWADSHYRWTVALSRTAHGRSLGVELESGSVFLVEVPGQRKHGWQLRRHPPVGDALANVTRAAIGFGWRRSKEINYVVFPIWSLALITLVGVLCFHRLGRGREVAVK
jgi:hypothetical protein